MSTEKIKDALNNAILIKQTIVQDDMLMDQILLAADLIVLFLVYSKLFE